MSIPRDQQPYEVAKRHMAGRCKGHDPEKLPRWAHGEMISIAEDAIFESHLRKAFASMLTEANAREEALVLAGNALLDWVHGRPDVYAEIPGNLTYAMEEAIERATPKVPRPESCPRAIRNLENWDRIGAQDGVGEGNDGN